jgi:hypothetical protein
VHKYILNWNKFRIGINFRFGTNFGFGTNFKYGTNFKFGTNFEFGTNFKFGKNSNLEQILNRNKFGISTKFEFKQISIFYKFIM